MESAERPEETPINLEGLPRSPRTSPARVTPEPVETTTVPPLVWSGGTVPAACATDATDSAHSSPNGSITPPRPSTSRRAAAKEIVMRPATTGKTSHPSSLAFATGSGVSDPLLLGYATMAFMAGKVAQQAAIPCPSADIRVSQQPTTRTPSE
jgi:hypothetical protein